MLTAQVNAGRPGLQGSQTASACTLLLPLSLLACLCNVPDDSRSCAPSPQIRGAVPRVLLGAGGNRNPRIFVRNLHPTHGDPAILWLLGVAAEPMHFLLFSSTSLAMWF